MVVSEDIMEESVVTVESVEVVVSALLLQDHNRPPDKIIIAEKKLFFILSVFVPDYIKFYANIKR